MTRNLRRATTTTLLLGLLLALAAPALARPLAQDGAAPCPDGPCEGVDEDEDDSPCDQLRPIGAGGIVVDVRASEVCAEVQPAIDVVEQYVSVSRGNGKLVVEANVADNEIVVETDTRIEKPRLG